MNYWLKMEISENQIVLSSDSINAFLSPSWIVLSRLHMMSRSTQYVKIKVLSHNGITFSGSIAILRSIYYLETELLLLKSFYYLEIKLLSYGWINHFKLTFLSQNRITLSRINYYLKVELLSWDQISILGLTYYF